MVSSADPEDDCESTNNYPSSLSRDLNNARSFSFASNGNSNVASNGNIDSNNVSPSASTAHGRGRSLDFGLNQSLRSLDTRYVEKDSETKVKRMENLESSEATIFDRKHTTDEQQEYNAYNNTFNYNCNYNNNYNYNRNSSFRSVNSIPHSGSSSSNGNNSNNSGYLSRTEPFDDASWSFAAGSEDENRATSATSSAAAAATTRTTTATVSAIAAPQYASDGENTYDHENDNDPNASDDPRYSLFRLLDLHCSVYPSDDEDNDAPPKAAGNNWEPIREWLEAMTTSTTIAMTISPEATTQDGDRDDLDEIQIEADDPHKETRERLLRAAVLEARGRSGQTVLHVACERSVPIDVLELLLSVIEPNNVVGNKISSSLALCSTIDGWLPLHYACNYPNEYAVVERLAEAFPEAKTHADLKGRTPLHFAMREENMNRPEVVALLACAAGIADDNGILVS